MNSSIYPLCEWKFNEKVSEIFDNHVRQSIPFYDVLQQMVVHLSDFFIRPHTVIYDLGCATGETLYQLYHRHPTIPVKYIGIDESKPMLAKAIQKNRENPFIQFVETSLESYEFEETSNLILSVFTLHFLPIEERKKLLKRVNQTLNKGGAFLLVEKTYPENAKIQDIYTQIYHDEKESNGLTACDIRNKEKALRGVLTPLTISENLDLLTSSGFSNVDVFFKHLQFTGFLAIK